MTLSTALQPWESLDGQLARYDAAGLIPSPALVAGRPTVRLPLAAIVSSPSATRRDMGDLAGLAHTLNEHGLLQPILVRPDGGRYELVFGERRLHAAQLAGWHDIEARVLGLSDEDAEVLALVENLQRKDLELDEEAEALQLLVRRGLTTRQIGARIGRSHTAISRRLRVFADPLLGPAVLELGLPMASAQELLGTPEPARARLVEAALHGRWHADEVRRAVAQLREPELADEPAQLLPPPPLAPGSVPLPAREPSPAAQLPSPVDLSACSLRELRSALKELQSAVAIKQALERAERVARHAAEAAAQVSPNSAALLECDILVRQADAAALPWPDGSIDLFVTSPVYPLDDIRYVGAPRYRDYASYLQQVDRWAAAMFRAAAPQGRACVNVPLDTRADGVPRAIYADWLAALLRAGWAYQTTIVWHEGNVSRLSAWGSYLSASGPVVTAPVEMIIVVHRGAWVLEDKARHLTPEEWTWTSGVWQFRGASSPEHTAPFPEELPRRAIKVFSQPGATVADPFLGEGTTGWVAAELGQVFRGSDISETWVAIALDNIARELDGRARAERVPHRAPVREALASG